MFNNIFPLVSNGNHLVSLFQESFTTFDRYFISYSTLYMETHRRCGLMPAKCHICNEKNTALIKRFSSRSGCRSGAVISEAVERKLGAS